MEELSKTQQQIQETCESVKKTLLEKNRRYGNSALEPKKVFSKLEADEAIKIRLDDKLSRIQNSSELRKNDVFDIIGYLTLLSVKNGWTFEDQID